jgi:hypothetical protein
MTPWFAFPTLTGVELFLTALPHLSVELPRDFWRRFVMRLRDVATGETTHAFVLPAGES